MPRRSREPVPSRPIRIPPSEQLLIDVLDEVPAGPVLATTIGRGQFAAQLAAARPGTPVICHTFDSYFASRVRAEAPGVDVLCQPDFAPRPFQAVCLPVDSRAETELLREQLQMGHQVLSPDGRLLVATNKVEDQFFNDELRKLFPKVTRRPSQDGTLYLTSGSQPLKKVKDYRAEFAFRDSGRLIRLVSRPGVFSHRSFDGGARALLAALTVEPGDQIIDMGCGSGGVAIAAALRAPGVRVLAVDSHARAIECTACGAALNEAFTVETRLTETGDIPDPGTWTTLVGNPPYFSDYRIAGVFLETARRALRPRGRVLMVTKTPLWFEEQMQPLFDEVETQPRGAYHVITGRQRR